MLSPSRDRRPARPRGAPLVGSLGALGLVVATMPQAGAQPPPADPGGASEGAAPPVALLVLDPEQEVLRERILGQTADLSWTVRVDPEPLPGPPERAAVAALARGTRAGARVVLWLRPGGANESDPGLRLFAVDVPTRRFLTRVLATGEMAGTASATAETAALVVRTTLRSLGLGGTLDTAVRVPDPAGDGRGSGPPDDEDGEVAEDGEAAAPPEGAGGATSPDIGSAAGEDAARRPAPPGAGEDDDAREPPDRRPGVHLGAEAGWGVAVDGGSAPVATGPVLGLLAEVGALMLGVRAAPGLRRPAQGDDAFRLRRTVLDLRLGGNLLRFRRARLDANGSAGLSIYGIRPREDAIGPAPSRSVGPTVGAGATVGIDLDGGFRLDLELGVTVLIRRPTLETREDGVITNVADIWPVQPQATLVVSWRTPGPGRGPRAARDR